MLQFEGQKTVPMPVLDLWLKLSDVRFLTECIPGVETVTAVESTEAKFTLRPGFSFVRGKTNLGLGRSL